MSALAPQALLEGASAARLGGNARRQGCLGRLCGLGPGFPQATPQWSLHCKQKWSDHLVLSERLPHTKDYVTI